MNCKINVDRIMLMQKLHEVCHIWERVRVNWVEDEIGCD